MSLIEKFKKQNEIYNRVKSNLYKSTGNDADGKHDSRNDKARLRFGGQEISGWGDQKLNIHASYGYYGSSSGYRAMDKETAEYIAQACNDLKHQIVERAVKLAQTDADNARKAATDEAKAVLQECDSNDN